MRAWLVCMGLLALQTAALAQPAPSAEAVLKAAYAKAAAAGRKVPLIFYGSCCGWCQKLHPSLTDSLVKPLIGQYYEVAHWTVRASRDKKWMENEGAEALYEQLGGKDQGLPG